MRTQVTKQFRLMERRTALLSGCVLALAGLSAGAQTPASLTQAPAASNGDIRFAVAHMHFGGWCYGYLYVTANQVRYEVVQPQSDHGHSFTADRAEVVAGHRTLFGQPADALKDFINVKVKRQSYNFLWLANEAEVKTGGAHRMTPPQAAPPDSLLAALENPPPGSAAVAPSQTAADAPSSQLAPLSEGTTAAAAKPKAQPAPAQELVPEGDVRFAVAHQHQDSSWCYGYLYVTSDQVRYEVVQPALDRPHGFAIDRSSVTARSLTAEAFQVVLQSEKYRFRWLANEADVNSATARPDNPPQAASPDIVIRKIQSSTAKTPAGMSRGAMELPARLELATGADQDARPALGR